MALDVGKGWWAMFVIPIRLSGNPKLLVALLISILLISSASAMIIGGFSGGSGDESPTSFLEGDVPGNGPLGSGGGDPRPTENTTYPWPMHMHDETHMGYTQSPAPTSNSVLWWNTTGYLTFGSPSVAEGKVFIGARTVTGDYMHAFYQNNGTLAWRTKTVVNVNQGDGGLSSSPAYSNGYLVYGGDRIYCVWASNGTIKWTIPTGNLNWGDGTPTISEGKVFIGGSDRRLYNIDLETGTVLWTFQTLATGGANYGLYAAPAVYNGYVYIPACDGWVYRIEINQPGPVATASHSFFTGYAMYGAPVIFDGKLYIGNGYTTVNSNRRFYALDVNDLSVVWEFYPGSPTSFLGGSAIAYDKLFVGSVDGNLYVLDPYGSGGTTTVIWQYGIGATWGSPAISSGQVFIGSKWDFVYAFDVNQTGPPAPAWTYNTAGNVDSSPAISDGRLYIGTHGGGGRIYAFGQGGDVVSPFPVSVSPTGTGVPPSTNIQVEWSEEMDWTSVEVSFSYTDGFTVWTAADGIFNHNPGARTSTFDPFVDLDFSTTYWVTFSSVATDLAGNPLDGNGDGTSGDDLIWSFTTELDNSPVVNLWEPGGTPGQSYVTGTSIPIVWDASDDNPWPNGGNVVNISYGVSPFGGTPISQFEFDDGSFNWDTTGIPLGTYYVNITAYDSLGQISGSFSNFTFDIVSTPDNPPSVSLFTPVGGEVWSGGTIVDITWDMSDDITLDQDLLVWINYSVSAAQFIIAGPLTGLSSPFIYPWTLPLIDSTDVTVIICVLDEGQHVTCDGSLPFEIDSTAPTVLGTTPMDLQTNVPTSTNVEATWSEVMNTTATEASFLLSDNPTWTPVSGILSWGAGNTQIIFDPDSDLLPNTWYTANISVVAKDDSDPGNNLATLFSWSFQTAGTPDTTAPVISNLLEDPDPQEIFGTVNISAEVTDDFQVLDVTIEVVGIGSFPMSYDTGSGRYYFEALYGVLGSYTYWIFANDTSLNQDSASGTFEIEDNTLPTISALQEDPDPIEIFNSIRLSAIITDNYALLTIRVNIEGVGNYTMQYDAGSGRYYDDHVCMMLGPHNYTIWASDTSGNWNSATGQFDTVDTQLPQISHTPPADAEVGVAIDVQATVTDNHQVDSVWIDFTNTAGSHFLVEMSNLGGNLYQLTLPAQTQAGTIDYHILASDVAGNGVSTQMFQVNVTDQAPIDDVAPMPPWGLNAEEGSDGDSTDLTWQAPVLNEDMTVLDDLAGYHLYRSESETGTRIRINLLLLETMQFTDSYVGVDITYYYWATAVDETGNESDYSALATITFSEQEDTSSWLINILVIILIVVVVLVAVVLLLMRRRKRSKESVEVREESMGEDQA